MEWLEFHSLAVCQWLGEWWWSIKFRAIYFSDKATSEHLNILLNFHWLVASSHFTTIFITFLYILLHPWGGCSRRTTSGWLGNASPPRHTAGPGELFRWNSHRSIWMSYRSIFRAWSCYWKKHGEHSARSIIYRDYIYNYILYDYVI
jgi:hypothetical protein